MHYFQYSKLSSLKEIINKRYKLILRAESNLIVIDSYVGQLEERIYSFAIARRYMAVR